MLVWWGICSNFVFLWNSSTVGLVRISLLLIFFFFFLLFTELDIHITFVSSMKCNLSFSGVQVLQDANGICAWTVNNRDAHCWRVFEPDRPSLLQSQDMCCCSRSYQTLSVTCLFIVDLGIVDLVNINTLLLPIKGSHFRDFKAVQRVLLLPALSSQNRKLSITMFLHFERSTSTCLRYYLYYRKNIENIEWPLSYGAKCIKIINCPRWCGRKSLLPQVAT